jgi:hypothetical protein
LRKENDVFFRMDFVFGELFKDLLEFMDTFDYLQLLKISNVIRNKCLKYKKDRMPFIVIQELFIYGKSSLSDNCKELFYSEQMIQFNTKDKLSRNMSDHLHQLLFQIVFNLGPNKSGSFLPQPLTLFVVPWRFRKCIDFGYHVQTDENELYISMGLYMTLCLKQCKRVIRKERTKDIESMLFNKIMRKCDKSKQPHHMNEFNTRINMMFENKK